MDESSQHEYLCDLISVNDKSTTVWTRASFYHCLLLVPAVKCVLIHSLSDHSSMLRATPSGIDLL